MGFVPTSLASATTLRLPSLKASGSGLVLELNPQQKFPVMPGTQLAFDLQLLQMCLAWLEKGQAPVRVIGDDQWSLPANPAPHAMDQRNGPVYKSGILVPVGVSSGGHWQMAEFLASTLGTRSSVEALVAQIATEMNAALEAGRDVAVAATFNGIQVVPMSNGNSYKIVFDKPTVVDTAQPMIDFRRQFGAMLQHCRNTPPRIPGVSAQPAAFCGASTAPAAWVPPGAPSPHQGAAQATPPWMMAPQAPVAPAAPDGIAF